MTKILQDDNQIVKMLMQILQDDYTANNFGQQESRDGYSAQGEYFVNLPDGRLQKVIFCSENSAEILFWDFPRWLIHLLLRKFCRDLTLRFPKVTYSVNGEGGYVADVSYTGEAQVKSSCNCYHHCYQLLQQKFAKNVHKSLRYQPQIRKIGRV